ncbi:MAG TPA: septal ring lytic transglycosylase RlpA family protein [Candidatus Competibacter sp.]|nr:septal ring lytic transglycosylase RlpA family protein [Candidatus Competibacteraceae bacterium]HRW67767.1 septal ring lytic transglycosylase RlpA family protein [Candidatus Competibacter sp.]
MAKSWSQTLLLASLAGALAGCGTIPDRPANIRSAGTDLKAAPSGDEPIPRVEPPSRSGNADTYVVFGRRYRVRETSEGYREEGTASWYGEDFHGRKTSSGPLYDMYELTAAHKNLPLPTYVRVTNLENGRSTVVKVTDRGPFVPGRIIDLSYAAALRLDMLERGTALVEVAALEPYQHLPELAARRAAERERLAAAAERKAQRLAESTAPPARTEPRGKPTAAVRLASAAPVAKSKSAPVERRAAPAGKNGTLYLVGTVSSERGNPPRQLQSRLASQLRRSVQVESTSGSHYQVRVPLRDSSEARQVAVRLAGLGISHSRVVAD